MTRFLHTSDWHLGATLDSVSRDEDHRLFLDHLAGLIETHRVDVLLVAGDIFDQMAPSAEALRLYYGFLRRVSFGRLRKVVIVGGNHDSPSRLDAPAEVLDALEVRVVGGFGSGEVGLDRFLVPIFSRDGLVESVVLAVPYIHEHRLGVRAAFSAESDAPAQLLDGFTRLYSQLCDHAAAAFPGVPLVATGHLACLGAQAGDAPQEIHRVGLLSGLPPSIFDPRISYVALGHIHRGYRVGPSRAWYCGTPIPLNAGEGLNRRRVLLVEATIPGEEATVESIPLPDFRAVLAMRGTKDSVISQVRMLNWTQPLPPFVQVTVEVPSYEPGLSLEVSQAAPAGARVLKVDQVLIGAGAGVEGAPAPTLASLDAEEVFRLLCRSKGEEADPLLLEAFRTVRAEAASGSESPSREGDP